MGWISAMFVHKALDAATELGCIGADARPVLCRRVGVEPDAPADPAAMISDSDFFDLLEHLDGLGPRGRSVPILMGASMRCDDYGAFGLAFKSAPDLLGSYTRVMRFGKVVTSVANFRVRQSDQSVFMEVIQGTSPRRGLTLTNELAIAAATALSREVGTETFVPTAIHLMAERPADEEAYRDHFRCPIAFGADHDAIEVSVETARRPNRLSDDGMSRFFERHLDGELLRFAEVSDLEKEVLDQIGEALSEGAPAIAAVAKRVGLSARTLQRRLSQEGLAYQDLITKARRTLAERLLRQTDFALAEIAFLTGFSDQSAFTRAFRRWNGQTPASFRRGSTPS